MKKQKSRGCFVILLFFLCLTGIYAQQFQYTPSEVKEKLSSLWNNYKVMRLPRLTDSESLSMLQQFGDPFLCLTDGSNDMDEQKIYTFQGRSSDMLVTFLNNDNAEDLAKSAPNIFFLTNESNKKILRKYINEWQINNGIDGDFF